MVIRQQEEALFARWSAAFPQFVADGVVDEDVYSASDPKVLLVLKEVNDPGGGAWDLRTFLRDGARPQTWNNVTRWLRGIRSLEENLPWSELRQVSKAQRRELLKAVAAVNLKKSPGGHSTEVRGFWTAVQHDSSLLREQLALYKADLVICCGSIVTKAFDAFLKPDGAGPWHSTSRGVHYLQHAEGKFTIAFTHPEARVPDNILYYALIDAVRELRMGSVAS